MKRFSRMIGSLVLVFGLAGMAFAELPPELEQDFQALRGYTLGGDFSACQRIIDAVTAVRNDPAKAAPLAERMARALSETGYDGQWFLCQWLYVIGTEREAPALARLVHDRKTAPLGLYAMRAIPGKGVDRELIGLLRGTRDPHLLCGILDCLGKRGVTESIGYVSPLTRGGNPLVARAAAQSLADMATPAAVNALRETLERTRPPRDVLIADA
ncbi:MAG TPA: HEAT repeat domain-containing protein, partial [Candidatus Hydrogenedentes bacterium]|nr:HEAT repeat domain-containing protein [Candidatus Hydrogenedentota bacterium]